MVISYVDSHETLPTLLEHLDRQDYPKNLFEVILVDGDDYVPRVSQAKGQMIGVSKAKGSVIFLTDSDRYPPPNWISFHMSHYPEWDLVGGNVIHHTTKDLTALNFGNISMKREVLEDIPINDICSQQDTDFAFRFVKQRKFKGIIDAPEIFEPEDAKWSWRHQFLMARNHMILRRKYGVWPNKNDLLFRIKHPSVFAGSIAGLIAFIGDPYFQGTMSGMFSTKIVNAHV